MQREITSETHFEDLVQQIQDCVDNMSFQNPYTPAQMASIGFKRIEKCVFYSDDSPILDKKIQTRQNLAYL